MGARVEFKLERAGLDRLIGQLAARGYQVMGPVAREGAIVLDAIASTDDLPAGLHEEQDAGNYRLVEDGGPALFGFTIGPHSWKRFLNPPEIRLWSAHSSRGGPAGIEGPDPAPRYAFLGVRPCDLSAIEVQDQVFLGGPVIDPIYAGRRAAAFIVVAQCGHAAPTCFCASMGTGPRARSGFDLALTELVEDGRAFYVVESGSSRGAEILAEIEATPASSAETEAATRVTERTGSQMGRQLDTRGLPEMLAQSHHHRRWDEVARRCLACGNCTQVCPTCFCATVGDHLDLSGVSVERQRRWDSCFALDFSYIHGGSVRPSIRARYRQWLTHKLGTWHAQFGRSGCVGCGRCITWCPAAIDLTEEIPALRRGGTSPAPS